LVDVKKDLPYYVRTMNAKRRATDETEDFYTAENFQKITPSDTVNKFRKMQEEEFRNQKDMYMKIKDMQMLDVDDSTIYQIFQKQGVPKRMISNLLSGYFTPLNYSKIRFENKIKAVDAKLDGMNLKSDEYLYLSNREFLFPQTELEMLKGEYATKQFFEETYNKETKQFEGGYYPEREDYKTDDKGNLIKDENGNPILEEGFIKRQLRKVVPSIKSLGERFFLPGQSLFSKTNAPPLPPTSQPVVNNTMLAKNDGLTRTENALLSEGEKEIAKRT